MNITISMNADGSATVRTSLGGLMNCANENDAIAYANGLTDGYNAAVNSLQRCHGWHRDDYKKTVETRR